MKHRSRPARLPILSVEVDPPRIAALRALARIMAADFLKNKKQEKKDTSELRLIRPLGTPKINEK